MALRKPYALVAPIGLFFLGIPSALLAQSGAATPEEVVAKVKEAAGLLAEGGEAALEQFRTKESNFVWKDSYVVVASCEQDMLVAHPINPKLEGEPLSSIKDESGKLFTTEMCEKSEQPQGGWVEYSWPKPGEQDPARKLGYVMAAPGTPYMVTAGVYDEEATLEQLEQLSGAE